MIQASAHGKLVSHASLWRHLNGVGARTWPGGSETLCLVGGHGRTYAARMLADVRLREAGATNADMAEVDRLAKETQSTWLAAAEDMLAKLLRRRSQPRIVHGFVLDETALGSAPHDGARLPIPPRGLAALGCGLAHDAFGGEQESAWLSMRERLRLNGRADGRREWFPR